MYLERSKSCLLNFTISSLGASSREQNALANKVLKTLLPHIGRTRQLTIYAEAGEGLDGAVALLRDASAPYLECLRISLLEFTFPFLQADGPTVLPVFFHGGTPLLRSARVRGVACFGQTSFTRLTSVSMVDSSAHFDTFVDFLRRNSETLTQLTMSRVKLHLNESDVSNAPTIKFPVLTSLHLSGKLMIYPFDTPRLESLYLNSVDGAVLEAVHQQLLLSKLQEILALRFWELDLRGVAGEPTFLYRLPKLQELEVVYCTEEEAFLKPLSPRDAVVSPNIERKGKKGAKGKQPLRLATNRRVSGQPAPAASGLDYDLPLPQLQSVTISGRSSWPSVQKIIEARSKSQRVAAITQVRYLGGSGLSGMGKWLRERDIGYQFIADKKAEAYRTAAHDLEWMSEENQFAEEGDDGLSEDSWGGVDDYSGMDNGFFYYDSDYGGYHSDLGVGSHGFYNWSNYSGSD